MKARQLLLTAMLMGVIGAAGPSRLGRDELPSLAGATGWLNSVPLTAPGLRGKVVLIDVWTYTCINWLRTVPYVRAWAEKYREHGLVVIGVHAPEFGFEKDLDNVRRAVNARGVVHPVAIDSDHAIWNALNNRYWPALYVVDARGQIRHRSAGEGGYPDVERVIQRLLAEAGRRGFDTEPVAPNGQGVEAAADWNSLRSPETYTGYDRTERFASLGGAFPDQPRVYALPTRVGLNQWAVAGRWTMGHQAMALQQPGGRVASRFHARDLHLVMGPQARGAAVRFRVLLDGRPPGAAHGLDVNEEGYGTVMEQRLYQLIRQPKPIRERRLEIEFFDPGVELFAFTFG